MIVLGIESSCDETGAAVVRDDGQVLSDIVQSQIKLHAPYGGVIPELASRDHARNIVPVIREALSKADVTIADLDGVAVTNRPGLVGALLVGVQVAKGMAWAAKKPLVGVDHLMGHLLAIFLRRSAAVQSPAFPFVGLLASGGHTALYRVDGPLAANVTELGATRDDAAGEAFDKAAKMLGLGYPGGPIIDKLSSMGDADAVPLAAPMPSLRTLEMSFSGLKTQLVHHLAEKGVPTDPKAIADVCASFQRAVTTVLARKLIAAAEQESAKHVVIGGGVAANRDLRRRVTELAEARGMVAFLPELASCTDNGAMIAYAGMQRLLAGERDAWDLAATSRTVLPRETRKGRGKR